MDSWFIISNKEKQTVSIIVIILVGGGNFGFWRKGWGNVVIGVTIVMDVTIVTIT